VNLGDCVATIELDTTERNIASPASGLLVISLPNGIHKLGGGVILGYVHARTFAQHPIGY